MRDEPGTFYRDEDFEKLFPSEGQPVESPWRPALILVPQFADEPIGSGGRDVACGA
jgi:transposase